MNRKRWWLAVKNNWLILVGAVLAIIFVYSDFFLGDYYVSFTNLMYSVTPWSSSGIGVDGPVLSDVIDSFYPDMYTTITDGTFFGFWNPNVALGTTSDISSWMYPLNYWYLLPLTIATLCRTLSEFLLAFVGMYLLMKAFGCKKSISVITGVCYCFSSVIVMWLGWQHSDVAALAPFAFFFFEKFLTTVQIRYCFGISASVYLMLVAGMPTYAGYFLYLLAIYVLCRTIWLYRKTPKFIWVIFAGTLAAVLLGAICSLPYTMNLLTSLGGNGYIDSREGQATAVLSMEYLHSMFFPYLRLSGGKHINESTLYIGLLPLITVFFTPYRFRKKKRMIFWCAALVVLFLLIFTHGLDFIFTKLPMINSSPKYRVLALFNFAAVILMGLNLNDLFSHREEYQRRKIPTLLMLFAGAALVGGVFLYTYSQLNNQGNRDVYLAYLITAALMIVFIAALLIPKIPSRVIAVLLCIVVVYDMGSFAKEYFPLVEKGGEDIPAATETISFLQENTTDERFAATGGWPLFANTNVFYGLNDVRGHNFVFTNDDMKTYYAALDSNSRSSATRYCLTYSANPTLLQYLGTKYVVLGDVPLGGNLAPAVPLYEGLSLSQEYIFKHDQPAGIVLLSATYGKKLSSEDHCILTITDPTSGEEVYSAKYSMEKFLDNKHCFLSLEGNNLRSGKIYTITFTADTTSDHPVTFWSLSDDPKPYREQIYNGEPQDSDLLMLDLSSDYSAVIDAGTMSDCLISLEFEEYSQRVELADTVTVLEDEEEVLDVMSQEFIANTAFITEEEAEKLSNEEIGPLTDTDSAEITDRTDDTVTIQVNTETPKLLMLNEYYDSDWKVYVNGEEQSIIKSNYLFRAVEVPAGDSVVEFRYQPKLLYAMFAVAGVSLLGILVLAVLHRRIQRRIDQLQNNNLTVRSKK